MSGLLVSPRPVPRGGGGTAVAARLDVVSGGRRNFLGTLSFRSATPVVGAVPEGDVFATASMLLAARMGLPLQIDAPVSARLLEGARTVGRRVATWFPEFSDVPVSAPPVAQTPPKAPGVGLFFSGGVDSFYSLLRHRDRITHLVLLHGFDFYLDKTGHRELVSRHARRVAAELGMALVEVETNARALSDAVVEWGRYGITLLASSAHFLAPLVGEMLLPSAVDYARLRPFVYHPFNDPLWSSERVQIVHDGCGATRVEKVAALAGWDLAMANLRVCWGQEGELNCGVCEKCTRTQLALRVCGALGRCPVFARGLDTGRVEDFVYDRGRGGFLNVMVPYAERGGDGELAALLAWRADRVRGELLAERLHAGIGGLQEAGEWAQISAELRANLFGRQRDDDPGWLIKKLGQRLPSAREVIYRRCVGATGDTMCGRTLRRRAARIFRRGRA